MIRGAKPHSKVNPCGCHGMTSLPLLCPPLAASDPICLHSASSTSALLQLQCTLGQLAQLCCTHSRTNRCRWENGSVYRPPTKLDFEVQNILAQNIPV